VSDRLRRAALVLLALAVTVAHLLLAERVWPAGAGAVVLAAPRAFDIRFVHELLPAEPPVAPPAKAARRAAAAPAAAAPASAAALAVAAPASAANAQTEPAAPTDPVAAAEPAPTVATADAAPAAAAAGSAEADTAAPTTAGTGVQAGGAGFEWPPSTRLQYHLSGDFRGPVEGQASVEWRREASRYQVDLTLSIGPAVAPLVSRSITSEGDITADGLRPARYDEITRMVLRDSRRLVVQMEEDRVVLAGGRVLPRPPGLQDSASQFVQLTWLFTTDPTRLREGQQIELPLALPRRLGLWVYEVGATEEVQTPAGPVAAVHVKPRRDLPLLPRPGGELAAEVWFAPSLQYLPVRMLIRQDEQTWVELRLASLPQQALAAGAPLPASSATGR
jgi:hypothetical protein